MVNSTVRQLAAETRKSVEDLVSLLKEAGIDVKNPDQVISRLEKERLLAHLRSNVGQVTLERKSVSKLKLKSSGGKDRTVQIIRKNIVRTRLDRGESVPESLNHPPPTEASRMKKNIAITAPKPVLSTPTELTEKNEVTPVQELKPAPVPEAISSSASAGLSSSPEKRNKTATKSGAKKNKKAKGYTTKAGQFHLAKAALIEDFSAPMRLSSKSLKPKIKTGRMDSLLQQQFEKPKEWIAREISIPASIKVVDLAHKMSVKAAELIKCLMKLGILATINQMIDQDTATIAVEEMGHVATLTQSTDLLQESWLEGSDEEVGEPLPRPPVVTIMGHVDHGKTSLLDYIRRTKVRLGEAGGITQRIGAYHVEVPRGMITFLDTPGHAAFTAMRARGAQITDIVVLVVAADDGVMPQTVEAIHHAQAAKVPIVVAINKMDKPDSDPERIQTELAQYSLIPETWGGDTMYMPVSAKTGLGIDELLESILTQAEMLELVAPIGGMARGIIIESRLEKGRGPVSSVLVQQGTLRKGDILLAGSSLGRVRALLDECGQSVNEARPTIPIEVIGLSTVAVVGDEAIALKDERKAREIALFRQNSLRSARLAQQKRSVNAEDLLSSNLDSSEKILHIVIKADSQGSLEALQDALIKLSTDEAKVKLISTGVGAITESDVHLAVVSKALLLGFNVRADYAAKAILIQDNLELHYHSVIYHLIDQVKSILSGLLSPEIRETIVGSLEVKEVFRSTKLGVIAGCVVTEGIVRRDDFLRVLRDNVVIHEGQMHSLRHFKEDVNEVRYGSECGICIKNYTDVREGDVLEMYKRAMITRTIG